MIISLSTPVQGNPVYRRHHQKADGRDLFLYGYDRPSGAPLPEIPEDLSHGGQLRFHPLRQEWNVYAAHRQNRTYKPAAANDPLAPSRAGHPPTEIPFTDFELAVFENKFTSLHDLAPPPPDVPGVEALPARGRCEVVVFGPEEQGSLATIGQARRRLLIAAWIDRYAALFESDCKFVMPFENRGDDVGVTLAHPHGQIYGFDFIPLVQQRAADAFAGGYDLTGHLAQMDGAYTVAEAGAMTAFCPPYARFPYEVWIAPRARHAGPWSFDEEACDGFAHLLGDVCRRYDDLFGQATPYMLTLQASPAGYEGSFHFTAQFYPLMRAPGRVKYLASVEQGTGIFTVDVMPEAAARQLRDLP